MKMRDLLVALPVVLVSATACTGTTVLVTPSEDAFPATHAQRFESLGVREVPSDREYPPAGNLTSAWVAELRASGIAANIYYPLRPDDDVDLILDSGFDVTFNANSGSNMAKSFFTGLTLFLLEPFFWYHFDYNLSGNVDVKVQDKTVSTIEKEAVARMSMKFLSLGEAQKLEGEVLGRSKRSLFRQVIQELPER